MRDGSRPRHFLMRIDDEVEQATDRAIEQIEAGHVSRGQAAVRELYERAPDLACTQYGMGIVHLMKDEPEEAARYFGQAVATFPYFAEAHYNLAKCHMRLLDPRKAIRSLMEARNTSRENSVIYCRAASEIADFEESVRRNDGVDLDTFLRAGELFDGAFAEMERGNLQQATIDFRKCIQLNPSSVQAHGNLGLCLARQGKKDEGKAMLEKALQLDPSYEPAQHNLRWIDQVAEGGDIRMASIEYEKERFLASQKDDRLPTPTSDPPAASVLGWMMRLFTKR